MRNVKIHIIQSILYLAPLFLIMTGLLLAFDPSYQLDFHDDEKTIAALLLQGHSVALEESMGYSERLFQKYLIQGLLQKPNIVLLGSSRTMPVTRQMFSRKKFFNHSVRSANLEDISAFYQLYKDRNLLPTEMILGLDSWFLNDMIKPYQWEVLEEHRWLPRFREVLRAFSPENFRKAFKKAVWSFMGKPQLQPEITENEDDPERRVIRSDGSMAFEGSKRNMPEEVVIFQVKKNVSSSSLYPEDAFSTLSWKRIVIFTQLMEEMQKDGVKITFVLPPYHPEAFEMLTEHASGLVLAEIFFKKFAAEHTIPVIGSYDPTTLNLRPVDFFDSIHASPEAWQKIL